MEFPIQKFIRGIFFFFFFLVYGISHAKIYTRDFFFNFFFLVYGISHAKNCTSDFFFYGINTSKKILREMFFLPFRMLFWFLKLTV